MHESYDIFAKRFFSLILSLLSLLPPFFFSLLSSPLFLPLTLPFSSSSLLPPFFLPSTSLLPSFFLLFPPYFSLNLSTNRKMEEFRENSGFTEFEEIYVPAGTFKNFNSLKLGAAFLEGNQYEKCLLILEKNSQILEIFDNKGKQGEEDEEGMRVEP
jgi:hypothetical protein